MDILELKNKLTVTKSSLNGRKSYVKMTKDRISVFEAIALTQSEQ